MRITSGVTDKYVYFVAVDSTDYVTRETALSSFTVYRSRDGAAAVAMTTPTVNETDATNMPGVYELLLDEDMTIGSGNDTEEMVFHITATGMAPVTRTIELYRPKFTVGSTLSLADINAECDTAISDASLATAASLATVDTNVDAILVDTNELQTNQGDWATATGFATSGALATVDSNVDAILVDTGTTIPAQITALNDIDAAGVRSAVGLASANLDTQLSAIDTVVDSVLVDTGTTIPGQISGLNNLSAADVNTQVDTALADYDGPTKAEMDSAFTEIKGATFSGTTDSLEAIRDRGDAAWTGGGSAPTVGEIADAVWGEAIADHSGDSGSTAEALAAAGSSGDPWITSLPGSYTGTQAGKILADVLADTSDLQANQGDWLTATVPTATENADALLNRDMSSVSDTNARSPLNALRFLRNKWGVSGTTLTVTKENDTTAAWTAAVTTNASAEPVTGSDPA